MPHAHAAKTVTCALQIGVHGAGLVNAYFLKPGAAVVEVLPCGFGALDPWPSQYFFAGSRLEAEVAAFQIKLQNASRCAPSALEKDPAGVNYHEGAWFVRATFDRDQAWRWTGTSCWRCSGASRTSRARRLRSCAP